MNSLAPERLCRGSTIAPIGEHEGGRKRLRRHLVEQYPNCQLEVQLYPRGSCVNGTGVLLKHWESYTPKILKVCKFLTRVN